MKECNKIKFFSEQEARAELVRIVEGNDYRTWKRVTPHRHYCCPLCSTKNEKVWHLTSKVYTTVY
jgi:hypothetical protein